MAAPVLVLASQSPRRQEMLTRLGVPFVVDAADIDETPRPAEAPAAMVGRLAKEKAARTAARQPGHFVLAADTTVFFTDPDEILGKAADAREATHMLRRLAGRDHFVATACALAMPDGGVHTATVRSRVTFRPLLATEIDGYIATGEWQDKAGAYAIQGIAAAFVSSIEGSYTNIVGLPLCETLELLARTGAPGPEWSALSRAS